MTDKEILDGNRLIAHFIMGAKCFPVGVHIVEDLKYHTSWDWLMPVIVKLQKNGVYQIPRENYDNILAEFRNVVEFVGWVNLQKK